MAAICLGLNELKQKTAGNAESVSMSLTTSWMTHSLPYLLPASHTKPLLIENYSLDRILIKFDIFIKLFAMVKYTSLQIWLSRYIENSNQIIAIL